MKGFFSRHIYYIKSNTKYSGGKMFFKKEKKSRGLLRRIFEYKRSKNSRAPNPIDIVQ